MTALDDYQRARERESVRALTIGELLDMFDWPQRNPQEMEMIERALGAILSQASAHYDDRDRCVGEYALGLAADVVKAANDFDKDTAKNIAEALAGVAYWMLADHEHSDWSPDTVARLKAIRDINPDRIEVAAE
jgi:hypothetical protein